MSTIIAVLIGTLVCVMIIYTLIIVGIINDQKFINEMHKERLNFQENLIQKQKEYIAAQTELIIKLRNEDEGND
ncbi:MAG: hypothetical protein NC177_14790 [Ruminococcus flavefaciens]|nr:hypothetical protein [Ruminococcus flavefaciens]